VPDAPFYSSSLSTLALEQWGPAFKHPHLVCKLPSPLSPGPLSLVGSITSGQFSRGDWNLRANVSRHPSRIQGRGATTDAAWGECANRILKQLAFCLVSERIRADLIRSVFEALEWRGPRLLIAPRGPGLVAAAARSDDFGDGRYQYVEPLVPVLPGGMPAAR
jgi:hypothetical protein